MTSRIYGFKILPRQIEIAKYHVGVGDGIISAGLVPDFASRKPKLSCVQVRQNFERFGSTHREEEVWAPVPSTFDLVMVAAGNFVGGNSGSPIFRLPLEFTLGKGLTYSGPRVMLLGLLSASIEGADLSEMTPVEYIFEIIKAHYPEAELYRGPDRLDPTPTK